jgi:hypothetical protein
MGPSILVREGAMAKMMGKIYLAVVQSALLYGSETWVLSEEMRGMLECFHNRCARQMTRQFIHPDPEHEGEWITPLVAATLTAAGLQPLMTYIEKRKARILVFAERSDLSKMSTFRTYSEQCQPAYLVAIANLA